jgi:hypothetical protein
MPKTSFNPQNLEANDVSFEFQQATYFQFAQPAYPIKYHIPLTLQ